MKVQQSVRDLYESRKPLIDTLKIDVDRRMNALREVRWHYESRVKTLESFAVKAETGRVPKPSALEDFLACTLVVPNSSSISAALELVRKQYIVRYQRPADLGSTRKAADAFPFDDLRLYCVRGNDGTLPEEPIDFIVFEVQIKTFLQHAWGIATHDLTYKTDDVRWSKDRIAAHLKATVEYAELTIERAEELSRSRLVELRHEPTDQAASIIEVLKNHWTRNELPENLRGLAGSLTPILKGLEMSAEDLGDQLTLEKNRLGGSLPLNLSPYGTIIQLLGHSRAADMNALLANTRSRVKILVTPELSFPPMFPAPQAARNIVRVD
ncbi:MAG TPA: hypothetical protein VIA98_09595 [Allosphingosinicella sp.]|jgi:ppGpp synthetase/RelA/SpoT-type nucleotidyltranferase